MFTKWEINMLEQPSRDVSHDRLEQKKGTYKTFFLYIYIFLFPFLYTGKSLLIEFWIKVALHCQENLSVRLSKI